MLPYSDILSNMELSTRGIQFFPEYTFPLFHQAEEHFEPEAGLGERMRLVLVEQGSGLLNVSGQQRDFIAPALVCLNEQERPLLVQGNSLKARSIYFHPKILNSAFSFETLRQEVQAGEIAYWLDRSSLRAFLERNSNFLGLFPLDPMTTRRAIQLFDLLQRQLEVQPDCYWICRSRSYLLELLSMAEQFILIPDQTVETAEPRAPILERVPASGEPGGDGADQVILYLHAHYPEKITISALTLAFHTNRTTLTEQFRRATSMPVMAYLAHLRMRQASLLLRNTTLPISEIMVRVGYQNSTHFWRTFHKHIGLSPTEYRSKHCWLLRVQ